MHICVLVTTQGRLPYMVRLLESLTVQDYADFSLLLGIQAPSAELNLLLSRYTEKFSIAAHTFSRCGLSTARNRLLPLIRGDFVALADDDCYYAPDAFARLARYAAMFPEAGVLVGRGFPGPVAQKAEQLPPKILSRYTVFSKAPSWCCFLRTSLVKHIGNFDESMGIGAPTPWQSGEETDYLLRILAAGHTVYRAPSIHVFHDAQCLIMPDLAKIRSYGFGRMYLLRKHKFLCWFAWINILYPLGHMVYEYPRLGAGALKKRFAMFFGRLCGFFAVRKHTNS